jgi:hypothetical protein
MHTLQSKLKATTPIKTDTADLLDDKLSFFNNEICIDDVENMNPMLNIPPT